jgi:hypothetical protein
LLFVGLLAFSSQIARSRDGIRTRAAWAVALRAVKRPSIIGGNDGIIPKIPHASKVRKSKIWSEKIKAKSSKCVLGVHLRSSWVMPCAGLWRSMTNSVQIWPPLRGREEESSGDDEGRFRFELGLW